MFKSKDPLIQKAIDFANNSLVGKKRVSGEDFLAHCLKTAQILEKLKVTDPITLSVAILHHSLAHGAATYEDLTEQFGEEIAQMIKTLDGLRVIKFIDTPELNFAENIRKMILAMAKDLRIVLIKLADIYDNLQTLKFLPRDKQIESAKETLEIFAPLTERLGIGELKGQMQDLAFKALLPQEYLKVFKMLKNKRENLEKQLLKTKAELTRELKEEKIEYRIESRTKYLYSLFLKLKRPEIDYDISKIYDLIAFRLIVQNTEDCYRVLGIISKIFRPMPGGISDFIANPKPNGYQSIHIKIFGPNEQPFEIQIRTEKMHEEAEFGVAAHWNYAEIKSQGASDEKLTKGVLASSEKLKWVKNLSKWQEGIADNGEFLRNVKNDFFASRIFVFTPKGDVKDLPQGATPVDFAYTVHSNLGDNANGAKVNGKQTGLDYKLKNGDVCEVSAQKGKKPNRDWLNFVVTSMARRKIKKAYLD